MDPATVGGGGGEPEAAAEWHARAVGGMEYGWYRAVPGGTGTTLLALRLVRGAEAAVAAATVQAALRAILDAHPVLRAPPRVRFRQPNPRLPLRRRAASAPASARAPPRARVRPRLPFPPRARAQPQPMDRRRRNRNRVRTRARRATGALRHALRAAAASGWGVGAVRPDPHGRVRPRGVGLAGEGAPRAAVRRWRRRRGRERTRGRGGARVAGGEDTAEGLVEAVLGAGARHGGLLHQRPTHVDTAVRGDRHGEVHADAAPRLRPRRDDEAARCEPKLLSHILLPNCKHADQITSPNHIANLPLI